jgi:hypothetical protein
MLSKLENDDKSTTVAVLEKEQLVSAVVALPWSVSSFVRLGWNLIDLAGFCERKTQLNDWLIWLIILRKQTYMYRETNLLV